MAHQGRVYWDAADSQWYAEPKRLARLGHLTAEKRPGKTRERTNYLLTDRGREAIAAWMDEPTAFPRIQHEPVVRLLAADLVDPHAVVRSLSALRGELADIAARLDVAEQVAT